MKIQTITPNNCYLCPQVFGSKSPEIQKMPETKETQNNTNGMLPNYPKPASLEPKSAKSFLMQGGDLIYDDAFMNKKPYTGKIMRKHGFFKEFEHYENGIKNSITIHDKDCEESITFQKTDMQLNEDLSKNILWISNAPDKATLFERYDSYGILCQVKLSGEAENNEKIYSCTTFNTDGVTVLHNFTTYTEDGKKRTVETNYKNGKRCKRTITGQGSVPIKGGVAEKIVKHYDEQGQLVSTEITEPKYYSKNGELWASSKKKVIDFVKKTETDYDYKTHSLKNAAAVIRNFIFEEPPHTIRIKSNDFIAYKDGSTGRVYADEYYKGGIVEMGTTPSAISDIKNGINISVKQKDDGNIAVFIKDKKSLPFKNALFEKIDDEYKLRKVEYFKDGKKTKSEHYDKNGSHWIENHNTTDKNVNAAPGHKATL